MGGDHGPGSIVDGALVAARHLQIGLLLVGARGGRSSAELSRHPGARGARRRDRSTRPSAIEMAESPAAALRRKPRASIRVAAEAVRERPRGRALQRRPHRRVGDGGARARSACCRASIGRRWRRSFRRAGRPAVLLDRARRVECRPQHLVQFAVHGPRVRAASRSASSRRASACCRSARKRARATS